MSRVSNSKFQDLVSTLTCKDFSHEELREINEALGYAWKRMSQATKRNFGRGDHVAFTSKKRGQRVTGRVLKVLRKNISVQEDNSPIVWRVSPNLLEKV